METDTVEDKEDTGSTQLRMAAAATEKMLGNLIWVQDQNTWYVRNDSGVYHPEHLEESAAIVAETVFSAKPEATSATVEAVRKLCRIQLAVSPDQFDTDPWIIGTMSGPLDLHTGKLLKEIPHNLYLTKSIACEIDPEAKCPKWRKHIVDVLFDGDTELAVFFQKHMGAMLVGSIRIKPQVFLFLQGQSGGGKGVTMHTLGEVLGDYAADFDPGDFTAQGSTRHSQWKTRFRGCRLAIVNEVKSTPLDMALLKSLTGGDKQVAHGMRENDSTFSPTQTLVFSSNVRPNFTGNTEGMHRRYLPLSTGPTRKETPGYEQALLDESSGIMNYLLEGLAMWQGESEIAVPERVIELRGSHIIDTDPMQVFVNTCLTIMPRDGSSYTLKQKATRRQLRQAYRDYLARAGDITIVSDHNRYLWGPLWDKLDGLADSFQTAHDSGWYGIYIEEPEP